MIVIMQEEEFNHIQYLDSLIIRVILLIICMTINQLITNNTIIKNAEYFKYNNDETSQYRKNIVYSILN